MIQLFQQTKDQIMVEKTIPLKGVRPDQFFRLCETGSLTEALKDNDKEPGLLYMVIPGAKEGKVIAVAIKSDSTKLPPQEFPAMIQVIPHDVIIQVKPAERVPFKSALD